MAFNARVQCCNCLSGAGIRPVRSALPRIPQPLRHVPVDQALRSEGDFPVLDARFQNIADLDMHLFADMLGNNNLKLILTVTISMIACL